MKTKDSDKNEKKNKNRNRNHVTLTSMRFLSEKLRNARVEELRKGGL